MYKTYIEVFNYVVVVIWLKMGVVIEVFNNVFAVIWLKMGVIK